MRSLRIKLFLLLLCLGFHILHAKTLPSVLIVVPAAEFNDQTFQTTYDGLKTAGFRVYTVSWKMTLCTGRNGMKVRPDLGFDSAEMTGYSAVILIGGPGSSAFWDDSAVHKLLNSASAAGKLIAGEGLAVLSIANTGLLAGKRCTALSTIKKELFHKKAVYTGEKVTVDGNFLTCNGPESAGKLVTLIIAFLKGSPNR
jgi:putative intracellular protease/amidase